MAKLDFSQYRLLSKIKRRKVVPGESIKKEHSENLSYLLSEKYICYSRPATSHSLPVYRTTPQGRAAIYDFRISYMKWWIPVVISIGSLIVSVIALQR